MHCISPISRVFHKFFSLTNKITQKLHVTLALCPLLRLRILNFVQESRMWVVAVLEIKKNPGCPYFKSWATKAVNLVALMNPWLPGRKTLKNNTSWVTTRYKFSFGFSNFCINTITANHHAIWCELQPRLLVFPCFLRFSFSFFFLVACICLAQFSFLLRRRLYTSQKTQHLHSVKDNTCILFC